MGDVAAFDFSGVDLVFFCGRAALSERYGQEAAAHAWVIDGSSAFRSRADVPLVAADVNPEALDGVGKRGLISLPGSASVALATALAPLKALAPLERVEVATYHAVSGSGRHAVDELAGETVAMLSGKEARGKAFGRQIAFNVIPQVDTRGDRWRIARRAAHLGRNRPGAEVARRCRSMSRRCGCRCSSGIASRCMRALRGPFPWRRRALRCSAAKI